MPPSDLDRGTSLVRRALVITLVTLVAIAPAAADPEEQASVVRPRPPSNEPVVPTTPPAPPAPAPEDELTAGDVARAPLPGDESGRTDVVDGGDSAPRQIARGLLFFPKLAADGVLAPLRGGVWAFDRYRLMDRYTQVFFNDAETIGLYPTIVVDTSLGVFAGGRFVHRDLFGEGEQLMLQAAWGSRFRQIYSGAFRSGKRLDKRLGLELDASYERRPHDAFYGIGNGDEMPTPDVPIDPLVDATAVETRFRQYRSRAAVIADLRTWRQLHVRAAGAIVDVSYGAGDEGTPTSQVYDPMRLVGWDGLRYGYSELSLRWDGRRSGFELEPNSVFSAGSLVDVYGGRTHRLDDGPDFWRYGLDAQHFVRIAEAPRVIVARFHGEAVSGKRDDVPFAALPMLGGPVALRGYELDRFRDRVAAFGSLAYQWDLAMWFSASLFVDAGRVYPSFRDLSLDGLRVGYGIGLEAHGSDAFVLEGSIASSIDGGLFLNLSFNPTFDLEERVRRK